MKLKGYPDSICDIGEKDFWSAMCAPKSGPGREILAEAIRLGEAGRKTRAYARLAEYHRASLAGEWDLLRRTVQDAPPSHPARSGQTAEDVLRHKIHTWHTTVVQFGEEIDWDFDKTDKYGFHYLGWLAPAVQRFLAKGEKRYRDGLMEIVVSYYRARNRVRHPKQSIHLVYYELGAWAKTKALLPLYLALLHSGEIPAATHEAFMKLFLGFARSLYQRQQSYRGGNWQIVGCSGLLTLAYVFPEFAQRSAWKRRALKYLKAHLTRDFYADGGHKERCWGYGYMSLNGVIDAYRVAERHDGLGKDAALFRRTIRAAFRWFARTLGPKERKPAWGDCQLSSGSGILDAGRAFFPAGIGRGLGVDRGASCSLKPSGFAIMRNGEAPRSAYLNISFGPWAGWHSHMDTLALNFWAEGEPLLEEVGRFGGYGEALTIVFRAPESHNQLTIDAMHYDIMNTHTRAGRDPVWHSTPEADFLTAWHRAYRNQPNEPQSVWAIVRRTVVFVKDPGYALVFDGAWKESSFGQDGPGFSVTQNWHSPFPFKVVAPGVVRTKGRAACLLAFARGEYLRRLETGADFAGDEATGTREYPERHYLRARRWMPVQYQGASGFGTLLYPFSGKMPRASIRPLPLKGAPKYRADAFEVTTPRGRDVIVLNPDQMPGLSFRGKLFPHRARLRLGNRRGEVVVP